MVGKNIFFSQFKLFSKMLFFFCSKFTTINLNCQKLPVSKTATNKKYFKYSQNIFIFFSPFQLLSEMIYFNQNLFYKLNTPL